MGQQICYLYEYKESVPVRNVGFIRAEQKRDGAVLASVRKESWNMQMRNWRFLDFA